LEQDIYQVLVRDPYIYVTASRRAQSQVALMEITTGLSMSSQSTTKLKQRRFGLGLPGFPSKKKCSPLVMLLL